MPFFALVPIWSSFLSILLCSKYLQSNFEVPGPLRSISLGLIPTVLRWQLYGAPIYLLILTSKIQTLINIALILFPEAKGIAEFEKEQILNLTNFMGLKLATLQLMRPVYLVV